MNNSEEHLVDDSLVRLTEEQPKNESETNLILSSDQMVETEPSKDYSFTAQNSIIEEANTEAISKEIEFQEEDNENAMIKYEEIDVEASGGQELVESKDECNLEEELNEFLSEEITQNIQDEIYTEEIAQNIQDEIYTEEIAQGIQDETYTEEIAQSIQDEIYTEEKQLEISKSVITPEESKQVSFDQSEEEEIIGAVDLTNVSIVQKTQGIVLRKDSVDFMNESYWVPKERDRTTFSEKCQRGDFPFQLSHKPEGLTLQWMLPAKDLDFRYYLPEFIKGLIEPDDRYSIVANLCVHDLIDSDKNKVKMALPYFMNDLYAALSSRYPAVCMNACKILQKLATTVGKHLGYYFDRLFGVLNMMRLKIEYTEGQKTFIRKKDFSLHPLYEEILKTWCILQEILIQISEKQLKIMMRCWVRPLPWLTF
ncbi:uncharacterized protein LOC111628942 [Centruroides sculpturatus]|uniref:uncharacterized protein LOC111628942 n=1 Tax=Centruroides sculpturatus TaxID=218467 RepID=UPI000C6CACD4|nr:uncharacterized protein LOC111628942 [Centruroides sculpturatus]